mmetsp:Transcript_9975/g.25808  ORF Transcript_9975/g.25808 Transcript_9975/m.25808 type:complete len:201 (-) Transcript_9975:84-686(-)
MGRATTLLLSQFSLGPTTPRCHSTTCASTCQSTSTWTTCAGLWDIFGVTAQRRPSSSSLRHLSAMSNASPSRGSATRPLQPEFSRGLTRTQGRMLVRLSSSPRSSTSLASTCGRACSRRHREKAGTPTSLMACISRPRATRRSRSSSSRRSRISIRCWRLIPIQRRAPLAILSRNVRALSRICPGTITLPVSLEESLRLG